MIEESRRATAPRDATYGIVVPVEDLAPDVFWIDIEEREQDFETWWAEGKEAWCYRHPVSTHLIDNSLSGLPSVKWGPGPFGRWGRMGAQVMTMSWIASAYGLAVLIFLLPDFLVKRFPRKH